MSKKQNNFSIFTVEGSGRFPMDMLRYDTCWPYMEGHDSPLLSGDYDAHLRQVVLQTCAQFAPTRGRWESFGWKVVPTIRREE